MSRDSLTSGSILDIISVVNGMIDATPPNLVETWKARSKLIRNVEKNDKHGTLPVSVALAIGLRLNGMAEIDELILDAVRRNPRILIEKLEHLKSVSSGGELEIEQTLSTLRAI